MKRRKKKITNAMCYNWLKTRKTSVAKVIKDNYEIGWVENVTISLDALEWLIYFWANYDFEVVMEWLKGFRSIAQGHFNCLPEIDEELRADMQLSPKQYERFWRRVSKPTRDNYTKQVLTEVRKRLEGKKVDLDLPL